MPVIFAVNGFFFLYFVFTNSYPSWMVCLHLVSLTIIFLPLFNIRQVKYLLGKYKIDLVIGTIFLISAFFLYLYKIEIITPGMWGDEITVGRMAEKLFASKQFTPFLYINYGHPTPLLYLTGFVIKILGRSITSIRLVSVFFGAANVALIYLFFRLFFNRKIAIASSLLFMFSYIHITISRFGYEMTVGIFFQILSLILLFIAKKKHSNHYLILFGFAIGLGLFSYLAFRTIALILLIVSLFYLDHFSDIRERLSKYILITGSIFLLTTTLLSYGVNHPDQIWARAKSVSLFNQGLAKEELKKEFLGGLMRTTRMFVDIGDPNPRQNPSGKTPFDKITVIGFVFGLLLMFTKNKKLFLVIFLLLIASISNDVFTIERIPEFHYYGLGHPNILRISSILPAVYFSFAYSLNYLFSKLKKEYYYQVWLMTVFLLAVTIFINFSWYYYQPLSVFNYQVNGVKFLKMVDFIKKSKEKIIYISPTIMKDDRFDYFVNKKVVLREFTPKEKTFSFDLLPKKNLVIFDPQINNDLAIDILKRKDELSSIVNFQWLLNPWGTIEAIIISSRSSDNL